LALIEIQSFAPSLASMAATREVTFAALQTLCGKVALTHKLALLGLKNIIKEADEASLETLQIVLQGYSSSKLQAFQQRLLATSSAESFIALGTDEAIPAALEQCLRKRAAVLSGLSASSGKRARVAASSAHGDATSAVPAKRMKKPAVTKGVAPPCPEIEEPLALDGAACTQLATLLSTTTESVEQIRRTHDLISLVDVAALACGQDKRHSARKLIMLMKKKPHLRAAAVKIRFPPVRTGKETYAGDLGLAVQIVMHIEGVPMLVSREEAAQTLVRCFGGDASLAARLSQGGSPTEAEDGGAVSSHASLPAAPDAAGNM
jgi:hypothetical protein